MDIDLVSENDIRGTQEAGLTIEYAWNAGKAVADWLRTAGSVVVVYAPTQRQVASAVIEGLRLQGRHVIDGGAGDSDAAAAHIKTSGLSGAVVVGLEQSTNQTTIALYQDDGAVVQRDTGLQEIAELVAAGNFVPAAVKGELTAIA